MGFYGVVTSAMIVFMAITGIGRENLTESGLLEIAQLSVLLVAFLAWLGAQRVYSHSLREMDSPCEPSHEARVLRAFSVIMLLAILTLIGRETSWLRVWGYGYIGDIRVKYFAIPMLVAALAYAVYYFRLWSYPLAAYFRSLDAPAVLYTLISYIWLLLGQAIENMGEEKHYIYWEEVSELLSYLTLCFGAAALTRPHKDYSKLRSNSCT